LTTFEGEYKLVGVGDKAPDFTLPDAARKPWKLSASLGTKLILAFFPGAFTSVCTKEMCTFRDSIVKFNDVKARIVGINVNDPFTNKSFAERNTLNFPLLSDYNRKVIRLYSIESKDFAGLKGYSVAKRSIFILDKTGVVRYKWVSEDPGIEPNYQEIETMLNQMA